MGGAALQRNLMRLLPGCGLEDVLDSLPLAIFLKDRDLRYTWCNTQFAQICGCDKDELAGKSALDVWREEHVETIRSHDLAVLANRERRIYDAQMTCPCGKPIDVRFLKIPATNTANEVIGVIGIAVDTSSYRETERRLLANLESMLRSNEELERHANDLQISLAFTEDQAASLVELAESIDGQKQQITVQNEQIRRLMYCDENTGLHNRRYFFDTAPELLAAYNAAAGSLAILDLDRFKRINDRHGHAAGDHTLRALARVARAALPDDALFSRIGGEEFACLLPGRPIAEAAGILEDLRRSVMNAEIPFGDRILQVTVSAGATPVFPGASLDDLLRTADAALYRAKRGGRNRIVLAEALEPPL